MRVEKYVDGVNHIATAAICCAELKPQVFPVSSRCSDAIQFHLYGLVGRDCASISDDNVLIGRALRQAKLCDSDWINNRFGVGRRIDFIPVLG
jgi:hypothetical protein